MRYSFVGLTAFAVVCASCGLYGCSSEESGTSSSGGAAGGGTAGSSGTGGFAGSSGTGGLAGSSGAGGSAASSGAGGSAGSDAGASSCAGQAVESCQYRKSCCERTVGFDQPRCVEEYTRSCEEHAARVAAGTHSVSADKRAECFAAIQKWMDKCELTGSEYYEYLTDAEPCREARQGPAEAGETCAVGDSDCNEPPGAKSWVSCGGGTCQVTNLVGEGSACEFIFPTHFCDVGLYCKSEPGGARCVKATAAGAACTPATSPSAFNFECGVGSWCDPSSSTCVPAKQPGEDCGHNFECSGSQCSQGKCGPPPSPVYAVFCAVE